MAGTSPAMTVGEESQQVRSVSLIALWIDACDTDAQVGGRHHPNIATKTHPTKQVIWMPISIQ